MTSIFLSHNHHDKPFVRRLAKDLSDLGAKAWVDEAEKKVGDSLIKMIGEGIVNTEYLGVVLSMNSAGAPWVEKEVEIALSNGAKTS